MSPEPFLLAAQTPRRPSASEASRRLAQPPRAPAPRQCACSPTRSSRDHTRVERGRAAVGSSWDATNGGRLHHPPPAPLRFGSNPQPELAGHSWPQLASWGHERPDCRLYGFRRPGQSAIQAPREAQCLGRWLVLQGHPEGQDPKTMGHLTSELRWARMDVLTHPSWGRRPQAEL